MIELWVRDTGAGVAAEDQSRIFERFARAKRTRHGRQGTGLGLTIVDRIAKAHGGSVTVSSVQGEGATFLLRLPWHREERRDQLTRILIVEDEDRIASFVAKGLRAEGFSPDVVEDGHEAIDLVRTGRYDLVVLDLGLPGLDGFSVLRMIRSERHELPVIILTARESIEDTVAGTVERGR
jgi:CheY-like chemotaxis protein